MLTPFLCEDIATPCEGERPPARAASLYRARRAQTISKSWHDYAGAGCDQAAVARIERATREAAKARYRTREIRDPAFRYAQRGLRSPPDKPNPSCPTAAQ